MRCNIAVVPSLVVCWFATTDCQFFQVEMTGARLLQNARNNFCNVHFMNCVFLNVVENWFKDVTFLNYTFHSFSDADFTVSNTSVNVDVLNTAFISWAQ